MRALRRTTTRPRLLRLTTVLPTVALAAAGVTAAVTTSTSAPAAPTSRPADYADGAPLGYSDTVDPVSGGVRATGWAFDLDAPKTPLQVTSTIDGKAANSTVASVVRNDVAAVYPGAGGAHGYSFVVPVPEGRHTICLTAKNVGRGKDHPLACATKVLDYGPLGSVDVVSAEVGSVRVAGWTLDPDAVTAQIVVRISVDGKTTTTATAKSPRPDIAGVRPGAGPNHGFDLTIPVAQGEHSVCVTAVNVGVGSDNSLGCRSVTVNDNPIGAVDSAGPLTGKLSVRGWALDHDRPTQAVKVDLRIDNHVRTITADLSRTDVAKANPGAGAKHGFEQLLTYPEGAHTVCVTLRNVGFGASTVLPCRTVTLNFTPTAALTSLTATSTGVAYGGWATDPDTIAAIDVRLTLDGHAVSTVRSNGTGAARPGHTFSGTLATKSGKHTFCATGVNAVYGTHDSTQVCRTITLALSPLGSFDSVTRSGSGLRITGWAFDPDTSAAATVAISIDNAAPTHHSAAVSRPDVGKAVPAAGGNRGFAPVIAATDGEHRVCVVATNVGGGSDRTMGCKIINAVHPTVPALPQTIGTLAGSGSVTVSWTAPTSDGGAPVTQYVVTASPGGKSVTAAAGAQSVAVTGLVYNTAYTFTVQAVNVVGRSAAATSPTAVKLTGPAPQTTPAPISTSRYIRNIRGSSAAEQTLLRNEGAADARANPAGHRYLILLDIGGQSQGYNGVVLSATTRFVSYADLLRDLKAYITGYHSAQKSAAPITIAVGTNNDMDVNATTGKAWAVDVINPLVSYARPYADITVVGANDIEPGFSASYTASRNWLTGYLANTSAKFVFNGSADGCAWTVTNRGCNNGWNMAGLYTLAAGAAPTRTINVPQVYNYTMADQWKYISLTGIGQGLPRINFGGPLTEYTACVQAGSCGSIGGNSAWLRMWSNLQSTPSLKVSTLPYATDLRIDQ